MIEILELLDHFKGKAYFVEGTTASGMGIIVQGLGADNVASENTYTFHVK